MSTPLILAHRRRARLLAAEGGRRTGMGDEFWRARKCLAEQRMREFDREPKKIRDIANVVGHVEAARTFPSAEIAETYIAAHALAVMEQMAGREFIPDDHETAGITRKSRRRA